MKTPQLGSALIAIPSAVTAEGTSSDPGTTGIPGAPPPSNVEDALAALQAEIDALVPPTGNFLTSDYGEQAGLVTVAASGAAYAIDCSLGNTFDITLTANCTLTITNPAPSGVDSHIVVILRQGGSGSYTVTWPGSVVWQDTSDGTTGGSAPTLWTAVGALNAVELSTLDGGTTWGGDAGGGGSGATTLAALTDVSLSSLADADRLRYSTSDSKWHNSALIWRPLMAFEPTSGNYEVVTAGGDAVMVEA